MSVAAPRVIIYARYSTENQNLSSVADQVAKCQGFVKRQGWRVVDTYTDEAISGRVDQRPGWNALQRAMRDGRCDVILADGLDRFSRDSEQLARLFKMAKFHRLKIFTVDGGQVDALQVGVSSIVSTMSIEKVRLDTLRALKSKAQSGSNPGGVPYGYRVALDAGGERIKGRLRIVEEEAIVIRRIFRDYAAGVSPSKIAAQLNEEGIPSPRGNGSGTRGWKQNTINGNRARGTGILNNERYVGRLVYNRSNFMLSLDGKTRVSEPNPESEWIHSDVPELRLMDDDLWNAVKARQDQMAKRRATEVSTDANHLSVNRNEKRREYLLSGLIKCGICGSSMTLAGGNKKGGKHAYYCAAHKAMGPARCVGMKGIHRGVVEEFALSGLRDGLMQPAAYDQFRDDLMKHMRASQSASLEQVAALDKRIRTLEKARTNLLNAIKSGAIVEDLADELNKVGADLKAARAQRAEAEVAPVELPENLPELYRAHIDDLTATLSDGSVSDAAADALRDLIARIVVHYDKASDTHRIELEGKIVELLQAGSPNAKSPAVGGAFGSAKSSLELVAGAGFEPATFRL